MGLFFSIMFRSILTTLLGTAALFGNVSAFGDGPVCETMLDANVLGNCIKKSACTTNEWSYGSTKNPVCDVAGSDYKLPDTLVCCLEKPEPEPKEPLSIPTSK